MYKNKKIDEKKVESENSQNEIKQQKKKSNKRAGTVFFIASMALVIGLFIGNSLMPAAEYSAYKKNPSEIVHNQDNELIVDMTPRVVNVDNKSDSFDQVAPEVSCCVVGVNCIGQNFSSVGSGVAVADGGYILTNYHVIEGANSISILLADSTNASATAIWQDKALDLAILKSEINLPWLEIADSSDVLVGEPVMAIGTPLSLQFQHSHTGGIISALNRTIAVEGSDGENYMQNLIQHDASINPGNSGGPAITLDGKVIGINTLKITEAEGIGFAIPAWIIKPVINHIKTDGSYKTVYLGIYGYDSTISKYYGTEIDAKGVVVIKVDEEGPCKNTLIESGDIITKVNGNDISTMLDLRVELYKSKVGEQISITFVRGDYEWTEDITLAKHPNATL